MNSPDARTDGRSRRSNGVGKGRTVFAGVDGRTLEYRRFRDVEAEVLADLGGADATSEGERLLARKAASLTVQTERLDARVAAGEAVDGEDYVRLANCLTRVLLALGLRRRARDVTPSLADYLDQKRHSDARAAG